jgi:hypothetical protein
VLPLRLAWEGQARRKQFFSEEKNQKTFMTPPPPSYPAMAGIHPLAQK